MAWTTDDLVAAVKRRAQLPDANGALTDEGILELANEEMFTQVIPMITTSAQHYYIKDVTFPLASGQAEYLIPAEVQAGTLFQVILLDRRFRQLGEIPEIPLQDLANTGASAEWGYPTGSYFAIKGDKIVFVPIPSVNSSGYLIRLRFIRRPNQLTLIENCAKVDSWTDDDPAAGRTKFSFTDTLPDTIQSQDKLDLMQAIPNFDTWAVYMHPANIDPNSFDVATESIDPLFFESAQNGIVDGLPQQSSYWCPAQTTCIVPLPDVFHPLLISLTVATVLRSLGDFQGSAVEQEAAESKKQRIAATIEPRTRSRGMKIISDSHPLRVNAGRNGWNTF